VSDVIVSAGQPLWIRTANGLAASGDTIDQQEILGSSTRCSMHDVAAVSTRAAAWIWPGRHLLSTPRTAATAGQRLQAGARPGLGAAAGEPPRSTLAELNLPDSVGALGNLTGGMVLVVGTTGAGKSTTLAAIVELVNRTRARHVITLEDPVEFVYQPGAA